MARNYNRNGYSPGHPWFYVLGGPVLPPSVIRAEVVNCNYRGHMERDISRIDALAEPKRSEELRKLREKVLADYRRDLAGYRKAARDLHAFRREHPEAVDEPFHDSVHTALSLKHNHLFNDFAHRIVLDELLSVQPDLFGA